MEGDLTDVLRIPGNESALAHLEETLHSGEGIAFLGAGISSGAYPLWNELVDGLIGFAVHLGVADGDDEAYWRKRAESDPEDVLEGLKARLGERWGPKLRQLYEPQAASPRPFTATHELLMHLDFAGYVTTNFDAGLVEARAVACPGVIATGYSTWQDSEELGRWLDGGALRGGQKPVLFIHGIYQRGEGIIATRSDYRRLYREQNLFRAVFDGLWTERNLVIAGFGFTDRWIKFAVETCRDRVAAARTGPRHVAIYGVPESEGYTRELRQRFWDDFGADVVLYPVYENGDAYRAFDTLLQSLSGRPEESEEALPARPVVVPHWREVPLQRWVHEPTDDENFVGRESAVYDLTRWAADPTVRVIGVTGMGGLGKTSLVGHWLRRRRGNMARPNNGLFYWSFYSDRDARNFFRELESFLAATTVSQRSGDPFDPTSTEKALLDAGLIIVLDGLETLQEPPARLGDADHTYGRFLDQDLRAFLTRACGSSHPTLVLLTSRFPFADLARFLGTSFRSMALGRMTTAEGDSFLERAGVDVTPHERPAVVDALGGHPLALRVFVAANTLSGTAARPNVLASIVDVDSPVQQKLTRLLEYYDSQLPQTQRTVLELISLSSEDMNEHVLLDLAANAAVIGDEPLEPEVVRRAVRRLMDTGLLVAQGGPGGRVAYGCHPVIREHFRRNLLGRNPDVAPAAADLLTGWGTLSPTAANVRRMTDVIVLLSEAGFTSHAHHLYSSALNGGWAYQHTLTTREGLQATMAILQDEPDALATLGTSTFVNYAKDVMVFAAELGESELVELYAKKALEVAGGFPHPALSHVVEVRAAVGFRSGRVDVGIGELDEALRLAVHPLRTAQILTRLALFLHVRGDWDEAIDALERAEALRLHGGDGVPRNRFVGSQSLAYCWIASALGEAATAREAAESSLATSLREEWEDEAALVRIFLARSFLDSGELWRAEEHLQAAVPRLRESIAHAYCGAIVVEAELRRRQHDLDDALTLVEEALGLAALRHFALTQMHALHERARIRLTRVEAADDVADVKVLVLQARDDLDAALRISEEAGLRDASSAILRTYAALEAATGSVAIASALERAAEDQCHAPRELAQLVERLPSAATQEPSATVSTDFARDLRAGACVPYIGAELAVPAGFPTREELLLALLETARESGVISPSQERVLSLHLADGEVDPVLKEISAARGCEEAFSATIRRLHPDGEVQVPEAYRRIARLPVAGVVTTNFDSLVEASFPRLEPRGPEEAERLIEDAKSGVQFLAKLYGSPWNGEPVIPDASTFRDEVGRRRSLAAFVHHLFTSRTILFVGASLDDIEQFVSCLPRDPFGYWERPHHAFLAVPRHSGWRARVEILEVQYGIKTIPYVPASPDGLGVEYLLAELLELVEDPPDARPV